MADLYALGYAISIASVTKSVYTSVHGRVPGNHLSPPPAYAVVSRVSSIALIIVNFCVDSRLQSLSSMSTLKTEGLVFQGYHDTNYESRGYREPANSVVCLRTKSTSSTIAMLIR